MKKLCLVFAFWALAWNPGAFAGVRAKGLVRNEASLMRSFAPLTAQAKESPILGKGRVRVLFFWASGCPNCKTAMANLTPSYSQWLNEGVSVYVISVDRTQAETQSFLDKTPLRMPFWWGGLNAKKTFQISILPTILILDEENRILSEYAGYSGERYFYLRKRLGSLLKTEDEEK